RSPHEGRPLVLASTSPSADGLVSCLVLLTLLRRSTVIYPLAPHPRISHHHRQKCAYGLIAGSKDRARDLLVHFWSGIGLDLQYGSSHTMAERARSGRARQYLEHRMARKTSLACAVAAGEMPGHRYGLGVKSYVHPSTPTPHVGLWTSQFSREGRATSHPCEIIAPISPSCTPRQNHNSPGRRRVPIGVA